MNDCLDEDQLNFHVLRSMLHKIRTTSARDRITQATERIGVDRLKTMARQGLSSVNLIDEKSYQACEALKQQVELLQAPGVAFEEFTCRHGNFRGCRVNFSWSGV